MKVWTVKVWFDWENSDDGMFSMKDDVRYLLPREWWDKDQGVFACEEDMLAAYAYKSKDEAEEAAEWLRGLCDQFWKGSFDTSMFPEEVISEIPDSSPEFISVEGADEVDLPDREPPPQHVFKPVPPLPPRELQPEDQDVDKDELVQKLREILDSEVELVLDKCNSRDKMKIMDMFTQAIDLLDEHGKSWCGGC